MELIVASIIAAAVGLWVYNDARLRGINGVPWALLTFLVLIVGLPLYLYYRPKGKLEDCPLCGKKKLSTLTVCPVCNNSSQPLNIFAKPEDAVTPRDKKVCNSCGCIIDSDWNFCPYCGNKQ